MNDHLAQAKKLHDELKRKNDVDAVQRLTEFLSRYEGNDRIVHSETLGDEIEKLENEERHKTGIPKLDAILDGFRSNQLIVIGSAPKSGKTQLCVDLARRMPNSTLFLFEESAAEVLYKYHKKGLKAPSIPNPSRND